MGPCGNPMCTRNAWRGAMVRSSLAPKYWGGIFLANLDRGVVVTVDVDVDVDVDVGLSVVGGICGGALRIRTVVSFVSVPPTSLVASSVSSVFCNCKSQQPPPRVYFRNLILGIRCRLTSNVNSGGKLRPISSTSSSLYPPY